MSCNPAKTRNYKTGHLIGEECEEVQEHLSKFQDGFKYSKARLIKRLIKEKQRNVTET